MGPIKKNNMTLGDKINKHNKKKKKEIVAIYFFLLFLH